MYKFSFMYPDEYDSLFTLPLAPEEFNTKVGNKNQTVDLIELGEVNLIKAIGLRDFSFKVLLPKDSQLCDETENFREPIFYLNKFREIKESKRSVILTIIRIMPRGDTIFSGNAEVTLEDYEVSESAGQEGDFWVDLNLKEYKRVEIIKTNNLGTTSNDGKAQVTQEVQRAAKETANTYTVNSGDSLWKIAKLQLNDGSRYKEIASLNGITDYNNLITGAALKLP